MRYERNVVILLKVLKRFKRDKQQATVLWFLYLQQVTDTDKKFQIIGMRQNMVINVYTERQNKIMKFDLIITSNHSLKKNGYRIIRKLHKLEKKKGAERAYNPSG